MILTLHYLFGFFFFFSLIRFYNFQNTQFSKSIYNSDVKMVFRKTILTLQTPNINGTKAKKNFQLVIVNYQQQQLIVASYYQYQISFSFSLSPFSHSLLYLFLSSLASQSKMVINGSKNGVQPRHAVGLRLVCNDMLWLLRSVYNDVRWLLRSTLTFWICVFGFLWLSSSVKNVIWWVVEVVVEIVVWWVLGFVGC